MGPVGLFFPPKSVPFLEPHYLFPLCIPLLGKNCLDSQTYSFFRYFSFFRFSFFLSNCLPFRLSEKSTFLFPNLVVAIEGALSFFHPIFPSSVCFFRLFSIRQIPHVSQRSDLFSNFFSFSSYEDRQHLRFLVTTVTIPSFFSILFNSFDFLLFFSPDSEECTAEPTLFKLVESLILPVIKPFPLRGYSCGFCVFFFFVLRFHISRRYPRPIKFRTVVGA